MRNSAKTLALAALTLTSLTFTQCKKDKDPINNTPADYTIDPSNANELSNVIVFGNASKVTGTLPTGTSRNTVDIEHDPSLSVTTGGATTYIPLIYDGTENVAKVYLMIKGATNHYFNFTVPNPISSGTTYVPMTIPKSVMNGNFKVLILLAGSDGAIIGNYQMEVPVGIKKPFDCATGSQFVSGSDGITQTQHLLNGTAGNVTIEWETYSVPDRIDVFLDGQWVDGTGTATTPPPPTCPCSNPLPGFVGDNGTFTIPVTASNRTIEVYVSGCIGGGTAWDYSYNCAQ